jgi:hypothetical protein
MKYIMITDWDNHWDAIPKNFTSYSPKMLKSKSLKDNLVSGTTTIFIRKQKESDIIEKSWIGKVYDVAKVPGNIFFRVELEKEIECPDEYRDYRNGWYIEE